MHVHAYPWSSFYYRKKGSSKANCNTLRWSNDGARLLFVADIRSRASLCSIDAAKGAGPGGEGVTVLTSEGSHALHGECGSGSLLVSSQSFMAPPELYLLSADGGSARHHLLQSGAAERNGARPGRRDHV